jgi:hypothetical protein
MIRNLGTTSHRRLTIYVFVITESEKSACMQPTEVLESLTAVRPFIEPWARLMYVSSFPRSYYFPKCYTSIIS